MASVSVKPLQFLTVNAPKQNQRECDGSDFCDREGPPYGIQTERAGQNPGGREQNTELTADRRSKTVNTVAECLEYRADHDAESCEYVADTDDAQCRTADRKHIVGGIEEAKQNVRNQIKDGKSAEHQTDGGGAAQPDRMQNTLPPARAVIVGNDRYHAVIETEDRHEEKALQLEIYAKHSGSCGREGEQDFVHTEGHDRSDGHH